MILASNIDLVSASIGGLIIGVSSAGYLYFTGRLTGISGFVENVCSSAPWGDKFWSWSHLCGLLSAGYYYSLHHALPTSRASYTTLAIGGLCVGLGTRLGSGCTSGHGICGLSRMSPRSLTAVLTFMTSGAITAYLNRVYVIDTLLPHLANPFASFPTYAPPLAIVLILSALFAPSQYRNIRLPDISDTVISYLSGLAFGAGLLISGMCDTNRVIGFLDFSSPYGWDPSLIGVMGAGVVTTLVTFHSYYYAQLQSFLNNISFRNSLKMGTHADNMKIDMKLIAGSALFGVGWGLTGMCPGPALVSFGGGGENAAAFLPYLLGGMALHEVLVKGTPVAGKKLKK